MIECENRILGADISGLVVGYSLAQHENNRIILEKGRTYGSLCGNLTVEGFRFVHFSFTKDEKVNQIFVNSSRSYRIYGGKHLVKYLKDKHKLYILLRPNSDYSSLYALSILLPLRIIYYQTGVRLSNWSENVFDLLKVFESKALGRNIYIII